MPRSFVAFWSKNSAAAVASVLASTIAVGCSLSSDDVVSAQRAKLEPVHVWMPVRDVQRQSMVSADRERLFASLDDGAGFELGDDEATHIHNARRASAASYTAGFTADLTGKVHVDVNVRAMTDASRGSVQVVLYDGDTLLAEGPSHALSGDWSDLTDGFDIALAEGADLRAQLVISRGGRSGFVRVTQLWLAARATDAAPAPTPVPTTTTPAPPPPPPPPPAGTCTLHADRNVVSVPPLAKPAYLGSVIDPVFGTKITRITGDPGKSVPTVGGSWGTRERHHYSKDQAWNADMSLLYLEERGGGTQLFLDGRTYQPLFAHAEESGDAARWHPRDPSVMLYVGDHDIKQLDVRTGARTTLATFSGYGEFTVGQFEGNLSADGAVIPVIGIAPSGARVAFAYDLVAKKKYPDIALPSGADAATISPKGTRIIVMNEDATAAIYDLQGTLQSRWTEAGLPDHYDFMIDTDGREVAVGSGRRAPYDGQIVKRRLDDGVTTLLSRGGFGSHTSTRNAARPGWAYVSFFETENYPPYSQEIGIVKLDGSGTVHRIAHHRSTEDAHDYYAEAHPSPSPDGSRVIFASDWGDTSGPIQAYVVELPEVAAGGCQ